MWLGGMQRMKPYDEWNDFDKIIYSHQNDIDNLATLSHDKMKNNARKFVLSFLVVEDLTEKKWIIYDQASNSISCMNFGRVTLTILNSLVALSPDSVHKSKYQQLLLESGWKIDDYTKYFDLVNENRAFINELFDEIGKYTYYKQIMPPKDFKEYCYALWREYRFICQPQIWNQYISDFNAHKDKETLKYIDEPDRKEFITLCHNEAKEIESTMVSVFHTYKFIYHDYLVVNTQDCMYSGSSYVSSGIENIFPLDFLHLLNGDAGLPKKCCSCGQLYYSNNGKSKYCPDCSTAELKKERAKQNRKSNVYRNMHHNVYIKIYNSGIDTNDFCTESNFYWDIIRGKEPSIIPENYNPDITTKEKYLNWLNYCNNHFRELYQ